MALFFVSLVEGRDEEMEFEGHFAPLVFHFEDGRLDVQPVAMSRSNRRAA